LAHFIEILQLSFCVMNYAHLVYGMQMASAARAWMYRQPQEDWENFLIGVNGFLNQAQADMRNHGVQAMLCPCIDCLNQKKFAQREIIFHHLVTRGFTKHYTCWNKHGEEGLSEVEAGCLNEGEVRHHANHDEDLDDSGLFEGNEPLLPPNVLRPEDITGQEVRGFDDGEVLQHGSCDPRQGYVEGVRHKDSSGSRVRGMSNPITSYHKNSSSN
jgi:hypothetical protein